MNPVDEASWVGVEIPATLALALRARRQGGAECGAEGALRDACQALGARAVARERGPEHVLEVFRTAWDLHVQWEHGDDPRSLLYYGSLSRCLDEYEACAVEATTSASITEPPRWASTLHTRESSHD